MDVTRTFARIPIASTYSFGLAVSLHGLSWALHGFLEELRALADERHGHSDELRAHFVSGFALSVSGFGLADAVRALAEGLRGHSGERHAGLEELRGGEAGSFDGGAGCPHAFRGMSRLFQSVSQDIRESYKRFIGGVESVEEATCLNFNFLYPPP